MMINGQVSPLNSVIINVLNGLSFGMILFLLGTGLTLSLGVMGILNLSHGALYMVGAYVGWSVAVQYQLPYTLALVAGAVCAGVVGLLIWTGFLRHMQGQLLQQSLLTLGLVHIFVNLSRWIWGSRALVPYAPASMAGSVVALGLTYPLYRLFMIPAGLLLAIGLWWFQERTLAGAMVRAGVDNREVATALGINLPVVATFVFAGSAMLAGMTGVLGAHLFGANLQLGNDVLLLALIVTVIGGIGSVQGALVGAMLVGLVDSFGKGYFPDFAMFAMYALMVVILLFKPAGLMGRQAY